MSMTEERDGGVAVLDHGYVKFINAWGSDETIIEAARMSTDKGFLGWGPRRCECTESHPQGSYAPLENCSKCKGSGEVSGDEKLLKYLWENKHHTPFEMAGMTIEVKAPIFVFREWHRHRTQSFNEMSARYIPLPDENYVPSIERLTMTGPTKQGQGTGEVLTNANAGDFRWDLKELYTEAEELYQSALSKGVPKELARLCLPVGRYSKMRASANLRNWLGFLKLRMDPAAQWEIRQYANVVADRIEARFPRTFSLFKGGGA